MAETISDSNLSFSNAWRAFVREVRALLTSITAP
jgi:hypothetical protein